MPTEQYCKDNRSVIFNGTLLKLRFKGSTAILLAALVGLSACATPLSGPTTGRVLNASKTSNALLENIQVIELTDTAVQRAAGLQRTRSLLEMLGDATPHGTMVERGDTLEVSIWEAPPAVLYGTTSGPSGGVATRAPGIPEQEVDSQGLITVPFVGKVMAAGRSPAQIAAEIEARLAGKAHLPQVVVRRTENSTSNVTIVGDVSLSRRMPLTAKGERLLDAVASAGGTKEPVGKITVQVTRGTQVASAPLETVIRDPRQNIRLAPDDVVTLLFQPYSFTALGAVTENAEIPFEGTGLTLAQALGRTGGIQDQRANPKGVFVFRMEFAEAVESNGTLTAERTDVAMVPVIYRVDMRDPASLFLAQRFEIRNRDVLYVSNSPTADFQKFLSLVSQAAFSLTGFGTVLN
jgi:polysaccharide biosynthesis/export protein